jgi:hypothetical protein
MSEDTTLPKEAIAALRANRKIDAIKLLREQQNIGLKEAKKRVEAYIDSLPPNDEIRLPKSDVGIGRLIIVGLGAGALFAAYKFFS